MSVRVKGLENIMSNLNKEIQKIEGRTLGGLIQGAIIIRRDMEFTPPLIPIDLGNLRASFFIVTSNGGVIQGGGPSFTGEDADRIKRGHAETVQEAKKGSFVKGPYVVLGFGAYYAAYVHEMVGANFQRHGAGALFLSNAIARNSKRVLKKIAEKAKIK